MTIQEAAKELASKLDPHSFTVGSNEVDTLYVYEHDRRYRAPFDLMAFHDFKIERKFVGRISPLGVMR